jgi:hypothetical protein
MLSAKPLRILWLGGVYLFPIHLVQITNECPWKVKNSESKLELAESKASSSLDSQLSTGNRKSL